MSATMVADKATAKAGRGAMKLLSEHGAFAVEDERQARVALAIIIDMALAEAEDVEIVETEEGNDIAFRGETDAAQASGVVRAVSCIFDGSMVPDEVLVRLEAQAAKRAEE